MAPIGQLNVGQTQTNVVATYRAAQNKSPFITTAPIRLTSTHRVRPEDRTATRRRIRRPGTLGGWTDDNARVRIAPEDEGRWRGDWWTSE